MQFRLLDILADPDNPEIWPLKLEIFNSITKERKQFPKPHSTTNRYCKFYCYSKDKFLVSDPLGNEEKTLPQEEIEIFLSLDDCKECIKTEVTEGIIYHEKDEKRKWFIIDEEIPVMFPLNLRDKRQEKEFIEKFKTECQKLGIEKPFYQG